MRSLATNLPIYIPFSLSIFITYVKDITALVSSFLLSAVADISAYFKKRDLISFEYCLRIT